MTRVKVSPIDNLKILRPGFLAEFVKVQSFGGLATLFLDLALTFGVGMPGLGLCCTYFQLHRVALGERVVKIHRNFYVSPLLDTVGDLGPLRTAAEVPEMIGVSPPNKASLASQEPTMGLEKNKK